MIRATVQCSASSGMCACGVLFEPQLTTLSGPTGSDGRCEAVEDADDATVTLVRTVQSRGISPSSPTSRTDWKKKVVGARRGDHFSLDVHTLPVTCSERVVTNLVDDPAGSHWDDPDAASVDARRVSFKHPPSPPPGPFGTTYEYPLDVVIDGETATTLPYAAAAIENVIVYVCPDDDYDSIRQLL